jgi:coenzyme F420-reducing hydrogenase gamma subunit
LVTRKRVRKKKLAVWKFASCDGCQLSLLACEDELLLLSDTIEIAHFLEATRRSVKGPYDLSLVEGSITTAHDAERIREVRRVSKRLVTIGACATAGGIQALRNFADVKEFTSVVYAKPDYIETLATSTAIADHVHVDYELRGCPINKRELLQVLSAMINGLSPRVPSVPVCVECKLRGNVCVMVAHGTPCLGPVTHAGCGALCPTFSRGCYGCYGPADTTNAPSLVSAMGKSLSRTELERVFSTFNVNAPAFRGERERLVALRVPQRVAAERTPPPDGAEPKR